MTVDDFRPAWLVSFDFRRPPGECPEPASMTAREYRTGRVIRVDLRPPVPCPLPAHDLVIAYDAPAILGCYLALGWPPPNRVLDLRAEFRCLTSGLEISKEDGLDAAVKY